MFVRPIVKDDLHLFLDLRLIEEHKLLEGSVDVFHNDVSQLIVEHFVITLFPRRS